MRGCAPSIWSSSPLWATAMGSSGVRSRTALRRFRIRDEVADDGGAGECLAGAGRALDREDAVFHVADRAEREEVAPGAVAEDQLRRRLPGSEKRKLTGRG